MILASNYRPLIQGRTAILIALIWPFLGPTAANTPAGSSIQAKLESLIAPQVLFYGASLAEAIEYLRVKSRDLDRTESDTSAHGVNFLLKQELSTSAVPITLSLQKASLFDVLRYTTEISGVTFRIDGNTVLILPLTVGASPAILSPPNKQTQERASKIVFPTVQFAGAYAEEAVEFLRSSFISRCYPDKSRDTPNLVFMPGTDPAKTFDLDLKDISLLDASRYIALQANLDLRFDANAIVFSPRPRP